MRGYAHQIYTVSYRAQAFLGFALVFWMIGSVPGALVREQYIGMPLSVAVITGVISLALLWPYLTPTWIAHPTRLNQLIPLTLAHLGLPLLYGFVGISAMVAFALTAPLANQMAVAMGVFLVLTSAICIGLSMSLCFTKRKAANGPQGAMDNVSILVPVREAATPAATPADDEEAYGTPQQTRVSRAS